MVRVERKKKLNNRNMQWWEKTVEYNFVMLVAQSEQQFLAPLDGKHEVAGDALFSDLNNNKWVLIEFKKDSKSIYTEQSKFGGSNYKKAKDALASSDSHHHIIYGEVNNERPNQLELYSQTYFSGLGTNYPLNLKAILSSGINYKEFLNYLNKLVVYKKVSQGGSGGNFTMSDYFLVAGINSDNQIIACINLTTILQRDLKYNRTMSQSNDIPH